MTLTAHVSTSLDPARALRAARNLLPASGRDRAWEDITGWAAYRRTPLVDRPDLAALTGVARLAVKDESLRSHLRSFKSLGGAYAVERAHERWLAAGGEGEFVATCTTDGNHGLSVAWGARALGVACVVYVPSVVSPARAEAIAAQGAEVRRIDGTYDDVTRRNAADADANGWTVVTDTEALPGEPRQAVVDVMQGYGILSRELVEDAAGAPPTHVFLQGGCGGLAGAVIPAIIDAFPQARIVVIEPERAACLQESARAGAPRAVGGDLRTRMVGMSVGEVSLPAWAIIEPAAFGYAAFGDELVDRAMRLLALPPEGVAPIESGETGCAGLVALLELERNEEARRALGLDASSSVVVVNTEGATDRESYERIVGVAPGDLDGDRGTS